MDALAHPGTSCARAAQARGRLTSKQIEEDLHHTVIHELFAAGLALQALSSCATGERRELLHALVDSLDGIILDVRAAALSLDEATVDRCAR